MSDLSLWQTRLIPKILTIWYTRRWTFVGGLATSGFHIFPLAQILDHLSQISKSNIKIKQIFLKKWRLFFGDKCWRRQTGGGKIICNLPAKIARGKYIEILTDKRRQRHGLTARFPTLIGSYNMTNISQFQQNYLPQDKVWLMFWTKMKKTYCQNTFGPKGSFCPNRNKALSEKYSQNIFSSLVIP